MATCAAFQDLSKRFKGSDRDAVAALTGTIESGRVTGVVGPDGAGKTTLLRLLAGLLIPDSGRLTVLGADPAEKPDLVRAGLGYMPQRFGLYEDLTVGANLTLYARLQGVHGAERDEAFARLLRFTGLRPFVARLAGALSGGMKQKLGLACALLRKPRLLLLDEPSVGVDPLSRRELWRMVGDLVDDGIAVVWSTAYLDEAERCAHVLLLDRGTLLFAGPPVDLTRRVTGRCFWLDGVGAGRRHALAAALARDDVIDGVIQGRFIRLVMRAGTDVADAEGYAKDVLAATGGQGGLTLEAGAGPRLEPVPPRFEDAVIDILGGGPGGRSTLAEAMAPVPEGTQVAVQADHLTKRFGSFTAASEISFDIRRGEIFGLLGPNGAGKSTTFKMLCGLLRPSGGRASISGLELGAASSTARGRIGYMAQKFSLYGTLTVAQNLAFFAGVYGLSGRRRRQTIARMVTTFALEPYLRTSAEQLPLGFKQRLALACAVMHEPAVLFLDEPTSGVDPITRREFWTHINAMVDKGMTVMVTTHFMDEAESCDRVCLIYQGRAIAIGSPDDLKERVRSPQGPAPTMEDAFIALIETSRQAQDGEEAAA